MKIYDRKILGGETTFSRSGIDKNDFTRLCIDSNYVFSRESIEIIRDEMPLTEEEFESLIAYVEE